MPKMTWRGSLVLTAILLFFAIVRAANGDWNGLGIYVFVIIVMIVIAVIFGAIVSLITYRKAAKKLYGNDEKAKTKKQEEDKPLTARPGKPGKSNISQLVIWRESVCAADDCDAPHEIVLDISKDSLRSITRRLLATHYLPLISGKVYPVVKTAFGLI